MTNMILNIDEVDYVVDITWDENIKCYRASVILKDEVYEGITKSKEGALKWLIITLELIGKQVTTK